LPRRCPARGVDREPIDDVAAARDPPGEHAGEALRLQPQDTAGERDHALFDRELDEAARLRRRAAHRLDLVPGALPDLIELQCRLLGERVPHQI